MPTIITSTLFLEMTIPVPNTAQALAISLVPIAIQAPAQVQVQAQTQTEAESSDSTPKGISPLQAIIIGIMQGFGTLPGISRSGSTIAGALYSGVDAKAAGDFSFIIRQIKIF